MTITLTPQTEMRLREKAQQDGQEVDKVADTLLMAALEWETGSSSLHYPSVKVDEAKPATSLVETSLAETLNGRTGLFSSGGAQMSENTGKKFAEGMAEKRRQGRL